MLTGDSCWLLCWLALWFNCKPPFSWAFSDWKYFWMDGLVGLYWCDVRQLHFSVSERAYVAMQIFHTPTKAVWDPVQSRCLIANQFFAFQQPKNRPSANTHTKSFLFLNQEPLMSEAGGGIIVTWPTRSTKTLLTAIFNTELQYGIDYYHY